MQNNNFAVAIQLIVQASIDGKPHHEAVLELCDTPQYLLDAGFPALRVVIKGKTVDKAHFDHGITRGILERLPDLITAPKALYRSATHPDSTVVVSFEQKDIGYLVLPMQAPVGRLRNAASVYCEPELGGSSSFRPPPQDPGLHDFALIAWWGHAALYRLNVATRNFWRITRPLGAGLPRRRSRPLDSTTMDS